MHRACASHLFDLETMSRATTNLARWMYHTVRYIKLRIISDRARLVWWRLVVRVNDLRIWLAKRKAQR
jgi:hypothetical protein